MKLLEVTWTDSISSGGQRGHKTWFTPEEAIAWGREELIFQSVGYVVMEDETNLVLATSRTAQAGGKVGGLWSIPKGSIVKRRRLK